MHLSPHFTLEELTASETARREGLTNQPGPDALANLRRLSQTLEQVRSLLGHPIRVNSAYRSNELNRRVGGVSGSAHTLGLAADISVAALSPLVVAQRILDSGSGVRPAHSGVRPLGSPGHRRRGRGASRC